MPLKMPLYTLDPPRGRCLLLAQKLHQATGMDASDCMRIAQRLFASHHPRDNPATVDVPEPKSADDLEATCVGLGVVVESGER
jgi:hypothetical protein